MLRAYKCRLYPNAEQREYFAKSFGCVRWVYNNALAYRIDHHARNSEKPAAEREKTPSSFDLQKRLTTLKKQHDWLSEVDSQSLKEAVRQLDTAYQNFFRRVKQGEAPGFPRFKTKHSGQNAFRATQNLSVNWTQRQLKIPKISAIKWRGLRHFEGRLKSISISQTATGKYFASLLVDTPDQPVTPAPLGDMNDVLGIDLGVTDFAIFSTGEIINNPRHAKQRQRQLKRAQRKLSNKQRGSNNYRKQKQKLARIHEKIANTRTNFLHQLTARITRENQTVALETLNVRGMMARAKPKQDNAGRYIKNGRRAKSGLARSIADASWAEFNRQLEYKCSWGGINLIRCGQFEASSKTCSGCGYKHSDMGLNIRHWHCPECGTEHHRDINAAVNIKRFAYAQAVGAGCP